MKLAQMNQNLELWVVQKETMKKDFDRIHDIVEMDIFRMLKVTKKAKELFAIVLSRTSCKEEKTFVV